MFKAKETSDRFINQYYPEDHRIFKNNYFFDLGATLETEKELSSFIPRIGGTVTAGWMMNLRDAGRNFPYAGASMELDVRITDRLTWATTINTNSTRRHLPSYAVTGITVLSGNKLFTNIRIYGWIWGSLRIRSLL